MSSYYDAKKFFEQINKDDFSSFVLGVDIGGTNTSLGVAGIKNTKMTLLFSLSFKSQHITSLIPALQETLEFANKNFGIKVEAACIGAAGVVSASGDYVELTNVEWNVSTKEILEKTSLDSVFIINDFLAVGYGINLLDHKNKDDVFTVRLGKNQYDKSAATKVVLGAGTGLGKSILVYDEHLGFYIPIPSEGGHGDFPAQNDFEMELLGFIKKLRGISQSVTYEELLSGRGIECIYLFLREKGEYPSTDYTQEIDEAIDKTPLISKYKTLDETCKETFRLFTRFYGRCAKNFVLDTLAYGGLYIGGGVASKNLDIFSTNDFIEEFENAYRRSDFLKEVPIYVVMNYDVSLYGACFAAMYNLRKELGG